MSRKLTLEQVKIKLNKVHGETVSIVDETYISTHAHATFVDKEFGEWTAQVKSVLEGRRHTNNKRFARSKSIKHTLDSIKRRLFELYANEVTLVDGQIYVNSHVKMKFNDKKYGEWSAMPYCVLNAYSGHPSRGQSNRAKKSRLSKTVTHWKTGQDVICTASYEFIVVNWLNENKIDFLWQIPFKMPDSHVYYVDLLITSGEFAGMYVEIKGTFARKNGDTSRKKWEWFHNEYSNSELWDSVRLKQLGFDVSKNACKLIVNAS
jgi:hypothetical protein